MLKFTVLLLSFVAAQKNDNIRITSFHLRRLQNDNGNNGNEKWNGNNGNGNGKWNGNGNGEIKSWNANKNWDANANKNRNGKKNWKHVAGTAAPENSEATSVQMKEKEEERKAFVKKQEEERAKAAVRAPKLAPTQPAPAHAVAPSASSAIAHVPTPAPVISHVSALGPPARISPPDPPTVPHKVPNNTGGGSIADTPSNLDQDVANKSSPPGGSSPSRPIENASKTEEDKLDNKILHAEPKDGSSSTTLLIVGLAVVAAVAVAAFTQWRKHKRRVYWEADSIISKIESESDSRTTTGSYNYQLTHANLDLLARNSAGSTTSSYESHNSEEYRGHQYVSAESLYSSETRNYQDIQSSLVAGQSSQNELAAEKSLKSAYGNNFDIVRHMYENQSVYEISPNDDDDATVDPLAGS